MLTVSVSGPASTLIAYHEQRMQPVADRKLKQRAQKKNTQQVQCGRKDDRRMLRQIVTARMEEIRKRIRKRDIRNGEVEEEWE